MGRVKRIPIKVAKKLATDLKQSIVVLVTWDGDKTSPDSGTTHVVTYGKSKAECEWAAILGNRIKKEVLNWPDEHCNAVPDRRLLALKEEKCKGMLNGTEDQCCERVGKYNGFGSDGPLLFICPKQCMCHD